MSYRKAEEILPAEVLALVQQYVDGCLIYIPRKGENHRAWGTDTKTREKLNLRNLKMYTEYLNGHTVKELAAEYFLTEKSVQRILRDQKPSKESKTFLEDEN